MFNIISGIHSFINSFNAYINILKKIIIIVPKFIYYAKCTNFPALYINDMNARANTHLLLRGSPNLNIIMNK